MAKTARPVQRQKGTVSPPITKVKHQRLRVASNIVESRVKANLFKG